MLIRIIFSPALFFATFWLVIVAFSGVELFGFYEFSDVFFIYLYSAFGVFALASLFGKVIANSAFPGIALPKKVLTLKHANYVGVYLFFMSAGILVMCWQHYSVVGANFLTPEGINRYRYMVTEMGVSVNGGILSLFNFFFYTAIPLLLTIGPAQRKRVNVFFVFLLFSFVYLSSARASMFVICIIAFFYYLLTRRQGVGGKLVLLIVLLASAFIILGILTGKGHFSSIWRYAFGPVHAFDQIVTHGPPANGPDLYLFRPIHSLLIKLGAIDPAVSRILPYISTPYTVNVYTVFGPYVIDFGVIGSMGFLFFWGCLTGFLVRLGEKYVSPYVTLLAALSMTLIILGVFYDYYLSSAFPWIIAIFGTFFFPKKFHVSSVNLIIAE